MLTLAVMHKGDEFYQ